MGNWDNIACDPRRGGARVFSVMEDGARYWIKFADKDYKNALQRLLLKRKRNLLYTELHAMAALRAHGFTVPQVVHSTPAYMVLSDLGESLQYLTRTHDTPRCCEVLEQLAGLLRQLHMQGCWHGNALLRNFVMKDGRIGLIDLENTAHRLWPLAMRQAYDIWQVLFSTARLPESSQLMRHFLRSYCASSRVGRCLRTAAWAMAPLYAIALPLRPLVRNDLPQFMDAVRELWWI